MINAGDVYIGDVEPNEEGEPHTAPNGEQLRVYVRNIPKSPFYITTLQTDQEAWKWDAHFYGRAVALERWMDVHTTLLGEDLLDMGVRGIYG